MKEPNSIDKFFYNIMSKSKLEVPFSDFDDIVMQSIEKKYSKKAIINRDIKLSWIFFILGSAFGMVFSIILPKIHGSIMGITFDKFTIPFLTVFSFIIVTQLDNLINFHKSQKIKTKR